MPTLQELFSLYPELATATVGAAPDAEAQRVAMEALARVRAAALDEEPTEAIQPVLGAGAEPITEGIVGAPPMLGAQLGAPPQVLTPRAPSSVIQTIQRRAAEVTEQPDKKKPKDWQSQMATWGTALQTLGLGLEAIREPRQPAPAGRMPGGMAPVALVPAGALYRPPRGFRSILAQYLR